jgi:hypothetical protein
MLNSYSAKNAAAIYQATPLSAEHSETRYPKQSASTAISSPDFSDFTQRQLVEWIYPASSYLNKSSAIH